MKIRTNITQTTANYFLDNNVKFTVVEIYRHDNDIQIVDVEIQNGMDVYAIYDAGRCFGRDLPNGF